MLLMIPSRISPELCTSSTSRRYPDGRSPWRRISVIPRIPFMGVRISWLMFARNSLFARFAFSALSFADCRSTAVSRTVLRAFSSSTLLLRSLFLRLEV